MPTPDQLKVEHIESSRKVQWKKLSTVWKHACLASSWWSRNDRQAFADAVGPRIENIEFDVIQRAMVKMSQTWPPANMRNSQLNVSTILEFIRIEKNRDTRQKACIEPKREPPTDKERYQLHVQLQEALGVEEVMGYEDWLRQQTNSEAQTLGRVAR